MTEKVCRVCLTAVDEKDMEDHVVQHLQELPLMKTPKNGRFGEANGQAKLTEDQVREIRKLAKTRTQTWIAKEYEVSTQVINQIVNKKIWTHIS